MKEKLHFETKNISKIKIVVIEEEIMTNIDFDCEDEDLNDFIYNDALNHLHEDLAVTYLCMINEVIVGFVSISSASVKINKRDKKKMKFKYHEFPSVKIGRLAIDKRFRGQGIGSFLIRWIFGKCEDISREIGMRFVSVDVYDKSVNFYKKNSFLAHEDNKRNILMYFDLKKYK